MRQLRAWFFRLLGSFRKERQNAEFADELESHLRMHIDDNLHSGMSPKEARRQALIKLGGVERVKERYHDRSGIPLLESFFQDLRYSLRLLGKNPGFTAIALSTLALGIGANTAMFSLLNALVLRTLPVHKPHSLVSISIVHRNREADDLSLPQFETIEARQKTMSGLFAYSGGGVNNVEADGKLLLGDIWEVTGNFFSELGARPRLGRLLDSSDVALHAPAPAEVAVIGYGLWQRYYGADPEVIGKTVRVEGVPFTVIGVMRKGFTAMKIESEPDIMIPLTAAPLISGEDPGHLYTSQSNWLTVTGRLKDGVSIQQAQADLDALWPSVLEATVSPAYTGDQRAAYLGQRARVESAAWGEAIYLRSRFTGPVKALVAVSGLVLMIACINLASLALARATSRAHEMGVRLALGASRMRLARQALVEGLLLSLGGAVAGVCMAGWVSLWLRDRMMQSFIVPPALNVWPDGTVLAFAAAIAIATGTLFSLAPIWKLGRQHPAGVLQQDSRTIGAGTGRFGRCLIASQVALSVVLLVATGLFARSFANLHSINPGFRKENILIVELFPQPGGYKKLDTASYYPKLVEHISNIPGVRMASMSHMRPLSNITGNSPVASATADPESAGASTDCQQVAPGFFETMGMTLIEGRDFTWRDSVKAPRVAILGQRLARLLFPSGDTVGQRIRIGNDRGPQSEVVGVVSDASIWNLRKQDSLEAYIPILQGYSEWSELIILSDVPPSAVVDSVRLEILKLGHEYAFASPTLESQAAGSIIEERLTATLSGFFGALSVLLAAIGLYGLLSYTISRRTREIGIRVALGARLLDIFRTVLREAIVPVVFGVAIGLPLAILAARLVSHLFFGVTSSDPLTLATVLLILTATGLAAGYFPARRASRSDPLVALRYE